MVAQTRTIESNARQSKNGWLSGEFDPTVAPGLAGEKSMVYRQKTAVGNPPGLFQKLDGAATAWANISALPVVIGTSTAPILVTAGTTIPFTSTAPFNLMWVAGNGAPQDMTATLPQIAPGAYNGQMLILAGGNSASPNSVTVGGAAVGRGVKTNGNGDIEIDAEQAVWFTWDQQNLWWKALNRLS
jgi:hypothetical protein